jgi:hypothetical protein
MGDHQLVGWVQGGPRALLAVAKGGVEELHDLRH